MRFTYPEIVRAYYTTKKERTLQIDLADGRFVLFTLAGASREQLAAALFRLLQDDALLAADDKRQHATSVDRQRYTDALFYQSDGFRNDILICHLLILIS